MRECFSIAAGAESGQLLRKKVYKVLMKLNIHLPYSLAVPFLGIHPREKKSPRFPETCKRAQVSFIPINQSGGSPRSHPQGSGNQPG